MLTTAALMYALVFTMGDEIIEHYGPIPLAFCEELRDGMLLTISSHSTGNAMMFYTGEWDITCDVFEPE